MNSLKTIVTIAFLAAIGYSVYVGIFVKRRPADDFAPPAWPGGPSVSIGGAASVPADSAGGASASPTPMWAGSSGANAAPTESAPSATAGEVRSGDSASIANTGTAAGSPVNIAMPSPANPYGAAPPGVPFEGAAASPATAAKGQLPEARILPAPPGRTLNPAAGTAASVYAPAGYDSAAGTSPTAATPYVPGAHAASPTGGAAPYGATLPGAALPFAPASAAPYMAPSVEPYGASAATTTKAATAQDASATGGAATMPVAAFNPFAGPPNPVRSAVTPSAESASAGTLESPRDAATAAQSGGFASTSAPPAGAPIAPLGGAPASAPPLGAEPSPPNAAVAAQFLSLVTEIRQTLDAGKLDEGLCALTKLYQMPELPEAQRQQLTELIGQVAGTVIYSREHLLEAPYTVRPGDTLERIAQSYQVTPELLAKINGLSDPRFLQPGQQLKVVRGPFSAVVNLDRHEMVLYLGERYAGRFAIGVGLDQPKLEGSYIVRNKVVAPKYYGPDGVTVAGNDPGNPLGRACLELGGGVALHGTNNPSAIGRSDNRGTIALADRDLDDVMGILTIGSRVTVLR